ncbi:MipA/OmpV family protein [Arenimonas daejeonensis]|uniref:MipA/OmpV family protein n=1 Tax=Arenimonas daejeonensis TaxID=370777 RepID=UPI001315AA6B|nr:MipA/OmpV family protein [Arenimonas daejeonensis]
MRLMLLLMMLLAAPLVQAQDPPPRWTLGVLAANRDAPYVGLDEGLLFAPLVRFEGERFHIRGLRAGGNLYENGGFAIDSFFQVRLDGYKAKDSPFLAGMDDRDFSLDGGFAAKWSREKVGQFDLAVTTDLLGRSYGEEVQLSYSALFRRFGWTFVPSLTLQWQDEDLIDYYFGVRDDEALPGRAAYRPGSAMTPQFLLLATHPVGKRWSVFTYLGYSWFPSEITDSPIVDQDSRATVMLGLGYSPD